MTVAALLLVAAACLWPVALRSPAHDRHAEHAAGQGDGGPARAPVTTREVADATVLLAVALRSGRGLVDAVEEAARVVSPGARDDLVRVAAALRWGRSMREAWGYARPVWRRTAQAFVVSDESGAASAEVLLEVAAAQRDEEARRLEAAGERAGVMLVLPLGLCFLPAFVATAVVPLVAVLVDRSLP